MIKSKSDKIIKLIEKKQKKIDKFYEQFLKEIKYELKVKEVKSFLFC